MSLGDPIVDLIQKIAGNPALLLLMVSLPFVLLARWKRVYPNKPLTMLVVLPVIPALGLAFRSIATFCLVVMILVMLLATIAFVLGWISKRILFYVSLVFLISVLSMAQDPVPLIMIVDFVILSIMVFDLLSIPRSAQFKAERNCQKTASLKKKHPVALTISNTGVSRNSVFGNSNSSFFEGLLDPPMVVIRDDIPQEFSAKPDQFEIDLPARSRTTLKYDLLASRRGAFGLDKVYLQVQSRLGLWKRILEIPEESSVNVYPDMKQMAEFELLARTNRLSLMGVRRTRRIGQDNDFERLRDYALDDNYKHIDWRSTARRQKLTVRDFQTSQSQRLIFMVDCGRMMTSQAAGLSLLDHSLNAMLMLSYIALKRGDAVGLICFSDRIHSFVPPRGASRQMNHLLRASFDRFPALVESRYGEAFLHLSRHCRKRSLVILMTNLIDEINANQVHQYLSTMVGQHLPLGVLLRDHELFRAADTNWRDDAGLYRAAAAAEIICWRHEVIKDLQHQGVLSLDVYPEDMTAPLINQYLEVKARHLL